MLTAGPLGFLIVWIVMFVAVYGLAGRFIGVTLFFAATATLYVLLPVFFFPDDAELFALLLTTVVLGVLGFYVGLTGFSGFSERRVFIVPARPTDWNLIACAAVILLTCSLVSLAAVRPGFVAELGSYEGRVSFSGRHGLSRQRNSDATSPRPKRAMDSRIDSSGSPFIVRRRCRSAGAWRTPRSTRWSRN